ncbi:heavy metal sensor histidine kinase [Teredinibacter turnerae]|uniref:heavy metal sensor histidine kinase n=1 Tax=Teredinibacter turnerae TaxID=2426 RepID=UPI000374734E|nr:heavy metal sensor histidine kinase [Teredinibacter turnerae]
MPAKRKPISLTLRVLLFVMLAIGVSLVLSGHLVLSAIQHHFIDQDTEELEVIERSIQTTLTEAEVQGVAPAHALKNAVVGHHGVYFLVTTKMGEFVYQSNQLKFAPDNAFEKPSTGEVFSWEQGDKVFRGSIVKISTPSKNYSAVIALDMAFHKSFLATFKRSLLFILLATGGITLIAAWLGIYQGHLPLRNLSLSIRQVKTNRLDLRLNPSAAPSELRELIVSFNHMIERLEEGFVRLSHFSSDIAHELRTPLTNIITQTQVALSKERSTEEYQELLYSSLEEQERLAKMVSEMLWLAKSDNDLITLEKTSLNLADETRELFDFFDALASDADITLSLEGEAQPVMGDRLLIRRALSNLISNAIRHTPTGGVVTVRVEEIAQVQRYSISNPGEPIPPEHLKKLFDRFYRVDPSRQRNSEGAGLGLAITKSIMSAHGWSIYADSDSDRTSFVISIEH